MTVKIINQDEVSEIQEADKTGQAAGTEDRVTVMASEENIRRIHTSRRAKGSFGDVLFVQLLLSVILGAGLWAGKTFGSGEVSTLCERIAEHFR